MLYPHHVQMIASAAANIAWLFGQHCGEDVAEISSRDLDECVRHANVSHESADTLASPYQRMAFRFETCCWCAVRSVLISCWFFDGGLEAYIGGNLMHVWADYK